MQAIVCDGYGPPADLLRLAEVDDPVAAGGHVVVGVRAASVNAADWHLVRGEPTIARLQMGLRRPKLAVAGCDFAGEVEAVGEGVTSVRPGDPVYGSSFMAGFGAFAERVVAPEDRVAPKPGGLSFEQAAAVPLAGMTALQGLRDHGKVGDGHAVLVIGASGGVGTFAVQVAKALGAEVTGVCSTHNVETARKLGADHVVDYTTTDDLGGPYDVVFQVSGKRSPSGCRRLLARNGTLVFISGDATGHVIGPVARMLAAAVQSPFVSQRLANFTVAPTADDLRALTELIEAGKVTPVIDRTYPLAEAPAAVAYVDEGHARGKVVVTV